MAPVLEFLFLLSLSAVYGTSALTNMPGLKVIDSHLHIWASSDESTTYPYAEGQEPPESLKDRASCSALLEKMKDANVDGALIVQPINHQFDHSYVAEAIQKYPDKLKGMMLHDPSLNAEEAVSRLEDLTLKGFCGVRFNPYLFPSSTMCEKDGSGLAVYKRCAELKQPVGIMCFKGFDLHYEDVLELIHSSPETVCILDHFCFTRLDNDENFDKLLSLAKYENVIVKISALFRQGDVSPYDNVKTKRFLPLLQTFGSNRLMFGTDFPFVLEEDGYKETVDIVKGWCEEDNDCAQIMSGTAERIFGPWTKS